MNHHRRVDGLGTGRVTRRELLKGSCMITAGLFVSGVSAHAASSGSRVISRFGIVTDSHYADADSRGTRFYRQSLPKMAECVARMNEENVDFLIELGDMKDQHTAPEEQTTLAYLDAIEAVFSQFKGPRYHVLGNHDVDSISKPQFLDRIENTGINKASGYYSFDAPGIHGVVLDANFNADGSPYDRGQYDWTDANISEEQLDWLRDDLAAASLPVMVFVHQQLDGQGDHYVNNADVVRQVLEEAGKVLAVFQGHYHAGQYNQIGDIHYYTLKAMIEGSAEEDNAYAIIELHNDHSLHINGFRQAQSMTLADIGK